MVKASMRISRPVGKGAARRGGEGNSPELLDLNLGWGGGAQCPDGRCCGGVKQLSMTLGGGHFRNSKQVH